MTTTKTPKSASTALAQNAAHNGALSSLYLPGMS